MMLQSRITKRIFDFKIPGGTSRGVLTQKKSWFLELWDSQQTEIIGIGESSVIGGLSPDYQDDESYEIELRKALSLLHDLPFDSYLIETLYQQLMDKPSIFFALETAILDLQKGGKQLLFENEFTQGKKRIPINGLIWMGEPDFMLAQIDDKLKQGFTCLKMKVGAIDFEQELKILATIREKHNAENLILRVDANGAFLPLDAMKKLQNLADLKIHSIEQPIQAGNWGEMKRLCQQSPLPIALDEELIGVCEISDKLNLLQEIKPQYIILKPSLHGGLFGCMQWIMLADSLSIPWWITSALESNVGLNAIAQFTASFNNPLHQGLGTGALYTENTPTSLFIENGFLGFAFEK